MSAENEKLVMYHVLLTRVLEGEGQAANFQRKAAFDNTGLTAPLATLVNKVANYAYKVTDDDILAVKEVGFTEDQIFELVVCAAVGEASRQYISALTALEAVTQKA